MTPAPVPPFGFLVVDKPVGITSHDAVYAMRRAARRAGWPKLKVGHAGTLDPLASGVLILCLGGATHLSEQAMTTRKRYTALVRLGVVTTTYDAEGDITAQADAAIVNAITHAQIVAALAPFNGAIQQRPPIYSAIKQGGRKLYDIARAGGTVDLPSRPVQIDSITIVDYRPPLLTLDVQCSAGTYIRSLAHDLGTALEVGASLAGLRRTASGAFSVAAALPLSALEESADAGSGWLAAVLDPADVLPGWVTLPVTEADLFALAHGRAIPRTADPAQQGGGAAVARAADGRAVALLRADDDLWRPFNVFV